MQTSQDQFTGLPSPSTARQRKRRVDGHSSLVRSRRCSCRNARADWTDDTYDDASYDLWLHHAVHRVVPTALAKMSHEGRHASASTSRRAILAILRPNALGTFRRGGPHGPPVSTQGVDGKATWWLQLCLQCPDALCSHGHRGPRAPTMATTEPASRNGIKRRRSPKTKQTEPRPDGLDLASRPNTKRSTPSPHEARLFGYAQELKVQGPPSWRHRRSKCGIVSF